MAGRIRWRPGRGWGRLFLLLGMRTNQTDRQLDPRCPVSLFLREDAVWLCARAPEIDLAGLSSPARQVYEILTSRGAMFANDLLVATRMLNEHLDDALGELVARGILTADGIAGLRALVAEKPNASRKMSRQKAVRKRTTKAAVGRWSVRMEIKLPLEEPPKETNDAKIAEEWAWQQRAGESSSAICSHVKMEHQAGSNCFKS